jgi:hypothetical protein
MTNKEVEEGMKALFDEALAVALGEIDEGDMTMPTELESLIRVSTFEEEGVLSGDPGIVLRFNRDGGVTEFQVTIVRSR